MGLDQANGWRAPDARSQEVARPCGGGWDRAAQVAVPAGATQINAHLSARARQSSRASMALRLEATDRRRLARCERPPAKGILPNALTGAPFPVYVGA